MIIKMIDSKIFSIYYLYSQELSDDDLHQLLDTNSLIYSLIIGMFRYNNSKLSDNQIIKLIKTQKSWPDNIYWKRNQYNEYTELVAKIYKNIYQCSYLTALSKAQFFLMKYGFKWY
jgi:hypothetical protein